MDVFPELVKVLSLLCKNPDAADNVSFRAAVCLGKLCVHDKNAQGKLSQVLQETKDTHIRAEVGQLTRRAPKMLNFSKQPRNQTFFILH